MQKTQLLRVYLDKKGGYEGFSEAVLQGLIALYPFSYDNLIVVQLERSGKHPGKASTSARLWGFKADKFEFLGILAISSHIS